jgi:3-dehydroquinate synthase
MQAVEISPQKNIDIKYQTILHKAYPIYLGMDIMQIAGQFIAELGSVKKVVVIADQNAMAHHGEKLFEALSKHFFISAMVLPEGEAHKTMETVLEVIDFMTAQEVHRGDLLIAFGGGVTGDITGFAASMYMRGIRYVQIPTTLMSQVDSSIGGKVGINIKAGKNLLGHFHNPEMVLVDPRVLKTLGEHDWKNGISELVKYAYTLDAQLLDLMPKNTDCTPVNEEIFEPSKWLEAIKRAIEIKVAIVEEDPKEQGKRKVLNFGHTLGHGLENLLGYGKISHGEAVAFGMMGETKYALHQFADNLDSLKQLEETLQKLEGTLKSYRLKTQTDLMSHSEASWLKVLKCDKKNSQSGVDLIWPSGFGTWGTQKTDVSKLAAFAKEAWS